MKIVNYEEFIRMPAGTIFAPYEPCIFKEELAIKTDTGEEHDIPFYGKRWCFNGVMPLRPWLGDCCTLYSAGDQEDASFEIYDGDHNDYDNDGLFAILEEQDVKKLIDILQWALKGCEDEPVVVQADCGRCVYSYGASKCAVKYDKNACKTCEAHVKLGKCPCSCINPKDNTCPYFEEETDAGKKQ